MDTNLAYAESKKSAQPAAFESKCEYDSGWQPADNQTNHNLLFAHKLGVTPSQISIFFSPDQETSYPLLWPWSNNTSGNPVSIWADTKAVTMSVFNGCPLHGNWNGQTASWTYWSSGFFRVFASA
ncbi:hypothetical protein FAZ95_25840 [Trinickia violacea]|uniref:Uncharacterized protein n=1 Tax=Trinickia violacea TaxID=2571746 RepID=A0A4P8IYF1_9BURK|nr:hypothetical protein [Trinickia violacea]QCP52583.1 hypothetical protein FAZ95_25840 [Trinickia violacea]